MPKFPCDERESVKNIVANLTITRASDNEIIQEIERQTGKSITRKQVYNVRQQIKEEAYDWYRNLQQGKYEYLYEFRERINEILWLEQKHHEIIKNNEHNPQIQQSSLTELHKLNITLANYFDVAPELINHDSTISKASSETKAIDTEITV